MAKTFQGHEKEWAKIVAQSWADEEFKAKLLSNPRAVLKAAGIDVPEDIKLNITEAKRGEVNLTLPLRPEGSIESLEELQERIQATICCCA